MFKFLGRKLKSNNTKKLKRYYLNFSINAIRCNNEKKLKRGLHTIERGAGNL